MPRLLLSSQFRMVIPWLVVLGGVVSWVSSGSRDPTPRFTPRGAIVDPPDMKDMSPRDFEGLHNVVAFHEGFLSGSVPEGPAGFDTLAKLGVKTMISVDGAEPDVAQAKARGIRYIHLPIGYNGFDEERRLQLVRATRDALSEGPVYLHCHHGKHRSAGAAGTIVASLGWSTPEEAVSRMKVSGTAPTYHGLYACTATAAVLAASVVDAVPADFPELSRPTDFVKGMVEVDEIYEYLKLIESAGWRAPSDHPDLVPVAEAGRMADLFRVMAMGDRVQREPDEFAARMRENEQQVQGLEDMLADGEENRAKLSEQFRLITASCKDCHVKYRD